MSVKLPMTSDISVTRKITLGRLKPVANTGTSAYNSVLGLVPSGVQGHRRSQNFLMGVHYQLMTDR